MMIDDLCPSVAVARVDSPELRDIETSLGAAIDDLGGLEQFVKPGMRVFLKPDLPAGEVSPELIADYMKLLTVVGQAVVACGGQVQIGDSLLFSREQIKRVWARTGLANIARTNGFEPVSLERAGTRPVIRQRRVYYVSRPATESDLIINLPRMRSAPSGHFRGAVWNLIGLLPGHQKIKTLESLGGPDGIAEVCADILSAVSPDLNIMYLPPESEISGRAAPIGLHGGALFVSCDAVALDTVVSELTGYEPESAPVLSAAAEAGLGIGRKESIRLRYPAGEPAPAQDRWAAVAPARRKLHRLAMGLVSSALTARIKVHRSHCSACGMCVNNCHINGLAEINGSPEPIWRESKCVHCWTCVENCPESALEIRWGLFSGGALSLWRKFCDV